MFHLASLGYSNICGIDYSEKAIEFCRQRLLVIGSVLDFRVVNVLYDSIDKTFNVIIDKGTYDAICLSPNMDIDFIRQRYFNFLIKHLKIDGYFIIFTCNFTKNEMLNFLSNNRQNDEFYFELKHEFDTPMLTFGGQVGKQVTGLIFSLQKKNNSIKIS